jgi:hypothetical protein
MTPVQRFYILLSILALLCAGLLWIISRLFKAGRVYQKGIDELDKAATAIVNLGDDLKELVRSKEKEHDRIDERMNRLEERLQQHESWHRTGH